MSNRKVWLLFFSYWNLWRIQESLSDLTVPPHPVQWLSLHVFAISWLLVARVPPVQNPIEFKEREVYTSRAPPFPSPWFNCSLNMPQHVAWDPMIEMQRHTKEFSEKETYNDKTILFGLYFQARWVCFDKWQTSDVTEVDIFPRWGQRTERVWFWKLQSRSSWVLKVLCWKLFLYVSLGHLLLLIWRCLTAHIRTPTSALCPWHRPVKRSCSFEVNGWCTSDVYNHSDYHPGDFRAWYHNSICGK